jgi:hypothetical protein
VLAIKVIDKPTHRTIKRRKVVTWFLNMVGLLTFSLVVEAMPDKLFF